MNQLTLSFLGAFEALLNGLPLINFRSAKVQGLLIYLVLTRQHAHERAVLATLFWPDEPERVANQNLRQSLYRLRQLLGDIESGTESLQQTQGEPFLLVTRTTVQFNAASNFTLDVAAYLSRVEARQLEQAVARYRGDLLPGFTCDSLPFDEWLRQEREPLHRLALDALFELTTDGLTHGDHHKAQRLARQQLGLEPWREEAHRQLMQALALSGERSAALAQYELCRRVLLEELGIEPAPETQTLLARIRDQQIEPHAHHRSDGAHAQQRLVTPFVGRQREFERLVDAYRQASRNTLQVVALLGNTGIGKSRLAQQFLAWVATQEADVLYGRSFTTSTGISYQPITHLLRQRLERENAPEDLLSDLWLSQLTRLLPELRERYPDLPQPTQEENTAREHLFEAVTRLIQAMAARKPLVLFVDDWHWADAGSLDLLHYAAVRWSEAKLPILLILTLRQEAASESPELQSWLTKLSHATDAVSLSLQELTRSDTEQLVEMLLASGRETNEPSLAQVSDWLFAETDGQPLFVAETLKALVADGLLHHNGATATWQIDWAKFAAQSAGSRIVQGVQEIIQGWLARISDPARAIAAAVSVLGQQATFRHLCQIAGLDELHAIDALDDLLGKQLLQEADSALALPFPDPIYCFSHQKVSEVVYAEASAARRRLLHRRAFETLHLVATPAADLAYHALHAGLPAETIRYSLIAGNEAMANFAVRVAIAHYERAWQIIEQSGWPAELSGADRQTLYRALGRAYELTEAWPKAQQIYETMISYAQMLGASAIECLGLNHLATVYLNGLNDRAHALHILERARQVAEQSGDRRGLAETEWNLSLAAIHAQDAKLALHHSERAVAIAQELGHPHLLARCLTSTAQAYSFLRQWDKALPYVLETHKLYVADGDLVMAANSQRGLGFLQIFSGHPAESLETLRTTLAFSRRVENLMGAADCAWILARTHLELGNYGEAIDLGRLAVEQTRAVGHPLLHALARSAWGVILRTVMDWDAAQATLLDLFTQTQTEGVAGWTDQAPELCALFAAAGDWEQAAIYVRQVSHPMHEDEPLLPFNLTGWHETEALLRAGDGAAARAGVARLEKAVGTNRRYRLILLRAQAVLAQWDGDEVQAIGHLQAALALAQEIGLPGEAWPILGELGRFYAAQGEAVAARAAYAEAAVIIQRLAATIGEEELRLRYWTAVPVQYILQMASK